MGRERGIGGREREAVREMLFDLILKKTDSFKSMLCVKEKDFQIIFLNIKKLKKNGLMLSAQLFYKL